MASATETTPTLGDCCVTGSTHTGEAKGSIAHIGELDTYVATPTDGSKAKTVVFITDVFGWDLINARLLADKYAEAGLYVLVPDLFQGDSLPLPLVERAEEAQGLFQKVPAVANMLMTAGPWMFRHREAIVRPIMENFIKALRTDSEIGKIGTVGFCWGGRYSFLLSSDNGWVNVDASVANHPSMLSLPKEATAINKPLLVQVGDVDKLLPLKSIEVVKTAFKDKKDTEVRIIPGAKHGFAVRGNLNDPEVKEQYDDAMTHGIAFLHKYLA